MYSHGPVYNERSICLLIRWFLFHSEKSAGCWHYEGIKIKEGSYYCPPCLISFLFSGSLSSDFGLVQIVHSAQEVNHNILDTHCI